MLFPWKTIRKLREIITVKDRVIDLLKQAANLHQQRCELLEIQLAAKDHIIATTRKMNSILAQQLVEVSEPAQTPEVHRWIN